MFQFRHAGVVLCLLGGVAGGGCTWTVAPPPPAVEPEENSPQDPVEAARAEMLRRIEAKRQAARELLAGRLTLGEAVDRFRAIRTEIQQQYSGAAGPFLPSSLEEEPLCREVIDYAREALRDRPDETERAVAHLEEELQTHLSRLGLTPEQGQENSR